MSESWFKEKRFTGSAKEKARKAQLARRIYELRSQGHTWAEAERLAKAMNFDSVKMTDWFKSRPWADCTPCKLVWRGSTALEDAQQHTAETGHATAYRIESSRVIMKKVAREALNAERGER